MTRAPRLRIAFRGRHAGYRVLLPAALLALPATAQDLDRIPAPNLAGVEAGIRDQLEAARRAAAETLGAQPPAAAADRAGAVGDLGRLYMLYGYLDAAVAAIEQASDARPDDPRWHYLLGVLHQEARRHEAAESAFLSALELEPDDVPTRIRRGQIALQQGRLDDAEAIFRGLLETAELAAAHHALGRVAESRGDWRRAAAAYERVLALQPQANAVHYALGLAYRQLGDVDRARSHLAQRGSSGVSFDDPRIEALNRENAGSAPLIDAGHRAMATGDFDAAVTYFRAAVERSPEDRQARLMLAQALTRSGAIEEAIAVYRQSLADRPSSEPVSHFNLGTLLIQAGELDAAARAFRNALAAAPDYADALVNLAGVLERLGDLEGARQHAERALSVAADEDTVLRLARLEAQLGELEAARTRVADWTDRHPRSAAATLAAGALARAVGDREAANAAFERVLTLGADDAQRAEAHLGLAALDRRRELEHFERASELAPARSDVRRALAAAYGRAGRLSDAAAQYEAAIALEPGAPGAHFGLATALILAGEHRRASEALGDAVTVLPTSLPLRHALARLLATSAADGVRDGARALALAEQVMRERPSIDHGETVAMALAEIGRFADAAAVQQQVIEHAAGADSERIAGLRRRLEQYRRGEPVRDRRGL